MRCLTRIFALSQLALLGLLAACRSSDTTDASPVAAGNAGQPAAGSGGSGGSAGGLSGGSGSFAGDGSGGAPMVPAASSLALGPFSTCVVGPDQMVKCAGRCGPPGKGGSRDQAPAAIAAQ